MRDAVWVKLVGVPAIVAASLLAAEPAKKGLEPVAMDMGTSWPAGGGPQFLGADRGGRVSLLRSADLAVVRQLPNGRFSAPGKLEATSETATRTLGAALSLSGDRWLVQTAEDVRLFVNDREKPLPQPQWKPWSVGFVGDMPVVAVIPLPLGSLGPGSSKQAAVPWLLAFDGANWSHFVEHRDLSVGDVLGGGADFNALIARDAVVLATGRDGRLWAGNQYSYRVQRFSASGKRLLDLRVGGGIAIAKKGDSAKRLPAGARAFTAAPIIRALTEGRDSFLYLLVSPAEDGRLVLDRFDPSRAQLDRVALPRAEVPGLFSLVAGKNGLYFASVDPRAGRWRLKWEALDAAPWSTVKDIELHSGRR